MRLKVLNRLKLNRSIASNYPGSSPEFRAWLGVHPIGCSGERPFQRSPGDPGRQPPAPKSELDPFSRFPPGAKYWVTVFEVRVEDAKQVDFYSDLDLYTVKEEHWYPKSLEELLALLEDLLDDTNTLDAPWYCDYP